MPAVKRSERISRRRLPFDIEAIRRLIELLVEHKVGEFEYSQGDVRIRIVQQGNPARHLPESVPSWFLPWLTSAASAPTPPSVPATPAPTSVPEPVTAEKPAPAPPPERSEAETPLHYIRSPIVGTFYRSPSPDAPPFVEVGSRVRKGQTVCIIEAMKIMNEIQSDVDGEVVAIYVENGTPVEYGAQLMAIRPTPAVEE
ncbi:Biotin carboxyl carrier protein of acetyl-CoA carboxylase [bacterium HR11]|nr:Biotin carboxyl carrier protein of acetyl-CoA carboxylase [bacterium HR11]